MVVCVCVCVFVFLTKIAPGDNQIAFKYYKCVKKKTTGRDLAQMCGDEYPNKMRICLWILAEITVIARFVFYLLSSVGDWVGGCYMCV